MILQYVGKLDGMPPAYGSGIPIPNGCVLKKSHADGPSRVRRVMSTWLPPSSQSMTKLPADLIVVSHIVVLDARKSPLVDPWAPRTGIWLAGSWFIAGNAAPPEYTVTLAR